MSDTEANLFRVTMTFDTTLNADMAQHIKQKYGVINDILKSCTDKVLCIHKYKVTGEQMVVVVFKVHDVVEYEAIVEKLVEVGNVTIDCLALTSYEQFAADRLGVEQSLTVRNSDNYVAGITNLLWCEVSIDFTGKTVDELYADWNKEATMALGSRAAGLKLDIFKVVAHHKVTFFVDKSATAFDEMFYKLPLLQGNVAALCGIVKNVEALDHYVQSHGL